MLSPIWGMTTSTAMGILLSVGNLCGAQTFLMPYARNAFERVDFVAAVKEGDFFHFCHAAREVELLGLEFIVVLPGFEEAFQESAIRDPYFGPDLKFDVVQTFRSSHCAS